MTTIVTRNGQITLDVDMRRQLGITTGTSLELNLVGDTIVIRKRDPDVFRRNKGFLNKDFPQTLAKMRQDHSKRLKRLGII